MQTRRSTSVGIVPFVPGGGSCVRPDQLSLFEMAPAVRTGTTVVVSSSSRFLRLALARYLGSFLEIQVCGVVGPDRLGELVREVRPQVVLVHHADPDATCGLAAAARCLSPTSTLLALIPSVCGGGGELGAGGSSESFDGVVGLNDDAAAVAAAVVAVAACQTRGREPSEAVVPPVSSPSPGITERYDRQRLTTRQLDVLVRLGAGKTAGEVAAGLGISKGTVEGHKREIRRRLGARTTAHALVLSGQGAGRSGRQGPEPP